MKVSGQPFGYTSGDIFGAGAEVSRVEATNELEILSKALDAVPSDQLSLEPFLAASWSFDMIQTIIDGGGLGHLLDGRSVGRVFYPKPLLRLNDSDSLAVRVDFPSDCRPLSCATRFRFSLYLSPKNDMQF